MQFIMAVKTPPNLDNDSAYTFAFSDDRLLLVRNGDDYRVPERVDFNKSEYQILRRHFLGTLGGKACFSIDIANYNGSAGFVNLGLREVFELIDDQLFSIAQHAFQIVNWDRMHQFCGRCGAETDYSQSERVKICPACEAHYYPRVSPAVIVAIHRENKLLLMRNKRYKHNFYSVLAGFVEPGESLEAAIVREVKEEVGIEVKNIRYFASQPWPFPDSLMIGFTADYAGGNLVPDGFEISEAGWYAVDDLPLIPGPISIARKLIDAFVEEQKKGVKG